LTITKNGTKDATVRGAMLAWLAVKLWGEPTDSEVLDFADSTEEMAAA
jgi:hypothetical protein